MLLSTVQNIVLAVFGVWLLVLTVIFYLMFAHYRRLVEGAKGSDLKGVLDKILSVQNANKKELVGIEKELREFEKRGLGHIQKVGLVRFNPFSETGGNQSFSLAMMDGHETGFVFTALHARDRSRIYLKPIEMGKSNRDLSTEEKKAISQAKKN